MIEIMLIKDTKQLLLSSTDFIIYKEATSQMGANMSKRP